MMFYGRVYYDIVKLIAQLDDNTGDQAARTGTLYIGNKLNCVLDFFPPITFQEAIGLLDPQSNGNVLRARIPVGFNPAVDPASRDQVLPLIIAAGIYGQSDFIKRVFWANVKRGMRYPNGDLMLHDIGVYIRAAYMAVRSKRTAILYPLLFLFDVAPIINTLLICFLKGRAPGPIRQWLADKLGLYFFIQDYPKSVNPTSPDAWSIHGDHNVGDDILHTEWAVQMKKSLPTPLSTFSNWLYAKYRPHGIQYAWDVYFDPKTYANPLNDLWRPVIQKLFYG